MNARTCRQLLAAAMVGVLLPLTPASAQALAATPPTPTLPAITVSATAIASVANDRMVATMRSESDNPDPAIAASAVNARMAKALARARAVKGIEVSTLGYTTWQVFQKSESRWHAGQTLQLVSADFTALSALVSSLQAEGGLTVSGINFMVSDGARRQAEEDLTQQAIAAWHARAQAAARGFGYESWHLGQATVQSDSVRPQPMFRAAGAMAASAAPIATEAGNTDVTVTVTGEALLDAQKPLPR